MKGTYEGRKGGSENCTREGRKVEGKEERREPGREGR
jgi:hypothetical protein